MSENAYLLRLKQLRDQKVESNEKKVSPIIGRPLTKQTPGPVSDPREQQPEEPQPDMTSMFGMNVENMAGQDKRFGEFMKEYTDLAQGLRQEVENGFMPMPIAQQRLQSYINDSAQYFNKNKAGPMDNPEISAMMEGMLAQAMQGQGQSQDQAPIQEEQPTMPVQGGMNG